MQTIYALFEANKVSEFVPGVGKEIISIDILDVNGKLLTLTEVGGWQR
jgi:hypothetical protein